MAQWHDGQCAALRIEWSGFEPRGPFREGPEKFFHLESHGKMLNLSITELFYSHILKEAQKSFSQHARAIYTKLHTSAE